MRVSAMSLLAAVAILGSCNDSPSDVHQPISGVWQVQIPSFGDSLDVRLSFGFDEVTHATADGGVRAQIMRKPGGFGMTRVLKEGHTVTRLEHPDGKTEIVGSVHLGIPFMTLEFSGTIDENNNFVFRYKSAAGSGNAVAAYAGEYARPSSPTLTRLANASLLDPNGAYAMGGTLTAPQGCGAGNCVVLPPVTLTGTLEVWNVSADGYGGTTISADYATPYAGLHPIYQVNGDLVGIYFNIKFGTEGGGALLELDSDQGFNETISQTFDAYMSENLQTGLARWVGSLTRSAKQ